jgi:hypothetical protein
MHIKEKPVEFHDEIHESLHREARVDYTKPIIRNG